MGITYSKDNPLRVFTAFSGYDSQCLALERLKRSFPDFDYTLVGWSEIDRYAVQAHNALFHGAKDKNYGDISKIDWNNVPNFDLFTYSFPCTDISSAGQQKGLSEGSGTRSSLLWECRKAIECKRPKFLLMENVKALVSEKFLPYFREWEQYLARLGYSNFSKVLNATNFGVPQHRERIFMVSILDENASYNFPEPFPLELSLKDVLETDVPEKYFLTEDRLQGLALSNLKARKNGNNFKFLPKDIQADKVANCITTRACSRKTDNFIKMSYEQTTEKYV